MKLKPLMLAFLLVGMLAPPAISQAEKPLVVATIAPIASIVGEAFNGSVDVVYLIPPGTDPHDYQLTTEQIALLQRASVVVTTGGHLPVEKKIAELKKEGTITARVLLIDDYKAFGFRYLKEHWYNGKDNPHGTWLDPFNALAMAKATEKALEEVDPSNAPTYQGELEKFEEKLTAIVEAYRRLAPENATAVIEMPPDQYALEWLGIRAVSALKPEEEVPARGVDELVPVAENSTLIVYGVDSSPQLITATLELARKAGKPVAGIRVFWSGKPYTEVLIENSASVLKALGGEKAITVPSKESDVTRYVLLSLATGVILGTGLGVLLKK